MLSITKSAISKAANKRYRSAVEGIQTNSVTKKRNGESVFCEDEDLFSSYDKFVRATEGTRLLTDAEKSKCKERHAEFKAVYLQANIKLDANSTIHRVGVVRKKYDKNGLLQHTSQSMTIRKEATLEEQIADAKAKLATLKAKIAKK